MRGDHIGLVALSESLTPWLRHMLPRTDPDGRKHYEQMGANACGVAVDDPGRERRLLRYERRAAKFLPLFGRGRAERPPAWQPRECLGCGAIDRTNGRGPAGWLTVRLPSFGQTDSYCPECLRLWGHPDEEGNP